jgi:hypothetical protein
VTNFALLNNKEHQDLRVISDRSPALGDDVMYALTYPAEFRDVQCEYPILFFTDVDQGQTYPVALLGFQRGENLFLNDNQWQADYIPASVRRQPFLIGAQGQGSMQTRVISIDLDHPRVSTEQGERLFEPLGGTSPYLESMANLLEHLHAGYEHSRDYIQALQSLELLEGVTLEVELNDGSTNQLLGFQCINEERLAALSAEQLRVLQQQGFLLPTYMVVASTPNMGKLVRRKNNSLGDQS